jgi:hypothetical protein
VVKRFFLLIILLCFILVPVSIQVMAQDELTETLESDDVGFSMSYPDGWESLDNITSGYLAVAEDERDLELFDDLGDHLNSLRGQSVIVVPVPTNQLSSFGEEAEERLLDIADELGQSLDSDDIEQVDVEGGYDTWLASVELDDAAAIVAELDGTEGYSFFIFAGAPLDDADALAENFRAMLDTVELATPDIDPNQTSGADYDINNAELIEYGDTVEGEITSDEPYFIYSFEGSEGDVVTISLVDTSRDDTLDPLVILFDEDNIEIVRNDDAGSDDLPDNFDSLIDQFELPADGTYYIVATRFGEFTGTSEGDFELTLDGGEGDGSESGSYDIDDAESIEYGDTVDGEVTDDEPFVVYSFEGSEGDVVTITMIDTSDDDTLDPQVILLDADGNEITRNDDAETDADLSDNFDSQITEFELEEDGTYFIVATRFGELEDFSQGEFELTLDADN